MNITIESTVQQQAKMPAVCLSPAELSEIQKLLWATGINEDNRLDLFLASETNLEGDAWWYAFRLAYELSRVSSSSYQKLHDMVKGKTRIIAMMEQGEVGTLDSLPDRLTLYKAMGEKQWQSGEIDLSWHLTKQQALNPPHHRSWNTSKAKRVVSTRVSKTKVIALLNNRRQGEVLIDPNCLAWQTDGDSESSQILLALG